MRPVSELIDSAEPAWPLVQEWIRNATVPVEILPVESKVGEAALYAAQVTTRSPMGAIAYNTAGIFIDNGWLRVLGAGGHFRLQRSLPGWNKGKSDGFYLIADDIIGGYFAINGGSLNGELGLVSYFAPDTLQWEPCNFGYSQFLVWAMSENLGKFYESLRWNSWTIETTSINGDQAISVYPFLCAEGPPIGERDRRPIPISELYSLAGPGKLME
jgi:hypothetical protein